MERLSISFALIVLSIFASDVAAQVTTREPAKETAPPANPCPQLTLTNINGNRIVREGEQIGFGVALSGGDQSVAPTFVWTTSAGSIVSGQSTRSISVDSTGAANDRQLTAELWIGGYPAECTMQASTTVKVAGPARKIVEFSDISVDREAEQIDILISTLAGTSDNVYVFGYAGRTSIRGYTLPVLKRIKARLVAANIPVERLGIIDAGFREQPTFELWIAPLGAEAPRPTPTIKAKDIVYPKITPAKKP